MVLICCYVSNTVSFAEVKDLSTNTDTHLCVDIAVTCDGAVSWLIVFHVSGVRMSWPVLTQPQPLVLSSDDAEWASGICDCCDDMRECTV